MGHLTFSFLQNAYILAISCTLGEHAKSPDRKSCLSLAQAFVTKASAALEAAAQLPVQRNDLQTARRALLRLVLPCLSTHNPVQEGVSGKNGWDRNAFMMSAMVAITVGIRHTFPHISDSSCGHVILKGVGSVCKSPSYYNRMPGGCTKS